MVVCFHIVTCLNDFDFKPDEASPAIGSSDDEVASEEEIDEEKKEQVNLDQGVDVEAVIQSGKFSGLVLLFKIFF